MGRSLTFSITLVCCLGVCIVIANEKGEIGVLLSDIEGKEYVTVDKFINKNIHINGSQLEATQDDECKCKNGRCKRVCDVEKTVPCLDKKKVCVCSRGFAEYDGECTDCKCGQDYFNCEFKKDDSGYPKKTCFCPKGYRFDQHDSSDSYFDYCHPECSDRRSCLNGGTCFGKKCTCPWGTKGDLCEDVYACKTACENRLELDCFYHQSESIPYCICKNASLYYDPKANLCKPCPCGNGNCIYTFDYFKQYLKCKCQPNYKEFRGYCKRCDCGFGFPCEFDAKGNKICQCGSGYYEREGNCYACGCMSYSDTDTKCDIIDKVKVCWCKHGFRDVLGQCEDADECEMYSPCNSSATCYNTHGSFVCQCPAGYAGISGKIVKPGEACEDIDECKQTPDPCWRWDNVRCVNLPGSYKCECLEEYEPRGYKSEPERTACVRTSKSYGPSMIVLFTSGALIIISCLVHCKLKKRAARLN